MALPLLPLAVAAGAALLLLTGRGGARAAASSAARVWPVEPFRSPGVISPFKAHRTRAVDGSDRYHAGVDVGAMAGDRVVAIDDGEVISMVSGYSLGAGLEAVSVRHPDADYIYAEIDVVVKPGDKLKAGDVIGFVRKNSSGNSMLHLEAWETGMVPEAFTEWTPSYRPPGLLDVGAIVSDLPQGDVA